jgi:RNA polymerase sigma-70 factor (ECF subfamily)
MPYASTFVRSAGSKTIALRARDAQNDQVPILFEPRIGLDTVLKAVAAGVTSGLGRSACNENIDEARVGRAGNGRRHHNHPRRADPDSDILALVDRGDVHGAVRRLIQRHGPGVRRYCCEALRDAALADDVYQQVFIEAFRDLPRFERRATVRFWLRMIARHRVLDAAKKRRSARNYFAEGGPVADPSDHAPSVAECLDEARLRAALLASVDELPAAARAALLLHYEHGLTFAEIAKNCRERSGTLCARVARALPMLRRRIEARLGCPP